MITEADVDYLKLAYTQAKYSKDRSVQNGAIIVNHTYGVISVGWNDIPRRVKDNDFRRNSRPDKYFYTEHAERAALFNTPLYSGRSMLGSTMYACWFACADCARAIILSGINRVVGHSIPQHGLHDDWDDSIKAGMQMLDEVGVVREYYMGKIGTEIRFKGEIIEV